MRGVFKTASAPDQGQFSSGEPIISLSKVCYEYSESRFALHDISLDIAAGEFVALTGPNGAGKTTLVKHINGLLYPQKGDVIVNSQNTRSASPAELGRYVGTCFQDPLVRVCTSSVREEVGMTLKFQKVPVNEIERRVDAILQRLGLAGVADEHPYRLSPGRLQCAALAAVLVSRPPILILDEPTSRLSRERRWEIMDLIRDVHRSGVTIIMISHDNQMVRNYSDRLVRMEAGRIVSDEKVVHGRQGKKRSSQMRPVPGRLTVDPAQLWRPGGDPP